MLLSIAAVIVLWDYPCQVDLVLEFHICPGSHCQYEPEKFFTLRDGCAVVAITFPSLPPFIRMWPNCNLLPEHTEQDRCIILIYAKPHSQITAHVILLRERWNILPTLKIKIPSN